VVILSSNKNFYPNLESEFIAFSLTEVFENYKLSENMQEIYELLSNFIKKSLGLIKRFQTKYEHKLNYASSKTQFHIIT
jgi:hypothetical protein